MLLRENEGGAGLPLGIERIKSLLEAFLAQRAFLAGRRCVFSGSAIASLDIRTLGACLKQPEETRSRPMCAGDFLGDLGQAFSRHSWRAQFWSLWGLCCAACLRS